MSAFKIHDLWGFLGAGLLLVLVYLALKNWVGANQILNDSFSGVNNTFKTLQGR